MTFAIFVVFLVILLTCLITGIDIGWALSVGLVLFFLMGLQRGYDAKTLVGLALNKGKQSMIVNVIMFLVGGLTGLWRASGTIAFCIYHGIRFIRPEIFLLLCFVICAVLSYILGTSFGVVGTMGVIMMTLARFGGVSEIITAGAVISGAYVGDRGSPASSSAHLVAAVTGTKIYRNVRQMLKTGSLALLISLVLHGVLSYMNPLQSVDPSVSAEVAARYVLIWPTVIPAIIMLVLPLLKVGIELTMSISMAAAAVIAMAVQKLSLLEVLKACFFGYQVEGELSAVLSGGGVLSMVGTCILITLTAFYSGILEGIHVLEPVSGKLRTMSLKWGRYPVALLTAIGSCVVFCNQTIAVMLSEQLLRESYDDREELAMDIENTAIMIAGVIPWSIASSAPRSILGVGAAANIYSLLLWMTPLVYLFTKRFFYADKVVKPINVK